MIYIAIFFILLLFSFVDKQKETKLLLLGSSIFFICVMSFRFGQGTDYFNYKSIYLVIPNNYSNIIKNSYLIYNEEPLFYLLNIFSKSTVFGFQFVIIFCAVVSYILLYKTIKDFSDRRTFSFFILFANYFFYFFNLLRQSLAMSIFLYALLNYMSDKKIKKYYFYCFICFFIHTASIISFLIPILLKFKGELTKNISVYLISSLICISLGFIFPKIIIKLISLVIPRYATYGKLIAFNYLPIGIRLIFSCLILNNKNNIKTEMDNKLCRIYLYGCLIYFCLSSISILSRLTDFVMLVEVILIPNIIKFKNKKYLSLFAFYFILLYSVLFFKDLKNAAVEDNYFSKNIFDYPLVTVFNKNEIKKYKTITQKNPNELIIKK